MSTQRKRNFWSIPSCSWHRSMGDYPKDTKVIDVSGCYDTPDRPKKGMPLGGIGAGNFMYNLCGTFGPWHMKPGRYEERFLTQAAFHVREQVGKNPVKLVTLATEDVLPAWQRLNKGDGEYSALFPRGWLTYDCFDTDISLLYFSPLIKDNYCETSLPVALFLFKVSNPGPETTNISVMFTFPNAPYTGPHNLKYDSEVPLRGATRDMPEAIRRWLQGLKTHNKERVKLMERERKGLRNEPVSVGDEIKGVLMRADDPGNPTETQGTEWCIATYSPSTYVTAWDGAGDGSDIWQDFSDGRLCNQSLSPQSTEPAGALAVQITLQAGEEKIIPFALAWQFPEIEFNGGTRWWRRYTEFFPQKTGQAFTIACEALKHQKAWVEAIEGWTDPIIEDQAIPDWLKQGALNELYYTVFGGSFWENGCINQPKTFGNRPGQHLHFTMECPEFPFAETYDVRHHACRSYREIWPLIEQDILLGFADTIMDTPEGSCPHDAGSPFEDPWRKYDYAWTWSNTHTSASPFHSARKVDRKTCAWADFSPKFIQESHSVWRKTGDESFIKAVWPAIVRTYQYMKTTDKDGDGISELPSSEYVFPTLRNGTLWIGALEALIDIAETLGEPGLAEEARLCITKARNTLENKCWNQEHGFYQFNPETPALLADGLIGQRFVDTTGLEEVLNKDRMTSHYRQAFRINVLPLLDLDGDGIGNMGAANALFADGSPAVGVSLYHHEYEVWFGAAYCLAANMVHWGKRIQDGALQAEGQLIGWGIYQNVWKNDATGYWFNTPECWEIDEPTYSHGLYYQRPRAIWELLMEVHNPFKGNPS